MPAFMWLGVLLIRGEKVLLDADLAALYDVDTRVLVQAVKRNIERFPKDFMFQLGKTELSHLRSQSVISSDTEFDQTVFSPLLCSPGLHGLALGHASRCTSHTLAGMAN